jgi:hypothetical protein
VSTLAVREDPIWDRWSKPDVPIRIQIQNAGAADQFRLKAETISKLPLTLSTEIVAVKEGSMEHVDVKVLADKANIPKHESLVITATSISNPKLEATGVINIAPSD